MNTELLIPLLTFGGTLLLVVTCLLNFSVFVRQLRAAREQIETARRQLESARQQPQIQLVQRAMSETYHLEILIEKPYLRPYSYENRPWAEGDMASGDEVKAMAELLLNNFASAIIHIRRPSRNTRSAGSSRPSGSTCGTVLPCAIFYWKASTASSSPAWLSSA